MSTVRLSGDVWPEHAEQMAHALAVEAKRGKSVTIDARSLTGFQPGAAARLGNILRHVRLQGRTITLISPTSRGGKPNWDVLIRSGIAGQILEQVQKVKVANGESAKRSLRSAVEAHVGHGDLWVNDLTSWDLAASRSIGAIARALASPLDGEVGTSDRETPRTLIEDVARLVAESVWNVLDHSSRQPLAPDQKVSSWLLIEKIRREDLWLVQEGWSTEDPATEYFSAALQWDPAPSRFLQVVVNDDGVGVAARQALDVSVLRGDIQQEREVFAEALAAGGSVKLRSRDCFIDKQPGFGSVLVAEALRSLRGYASIRTGRLLAHLDGGAVSAEEPSFSIGATERTYLAGTTLQILIPLGVPLEDRGAAAQESLFG